MSSKFHAYFGNHDPSLTSSCHCSSRTWKFNFNAGPQRNHSCTHVMRTRAHTEYMIAYLYILIITIVILIIIILIMIVKILIIILIIIMITMIIMMIYLSLHRCTYALCVYKHVFACNIYIHTYIHIYRRIHPYLDVRMYVGIYLQPLGHPSHCPDVS